MVTAAQHRLEERISSLGIRVQRAGRFHLMHARQRYARLSAESVLSRLRDDVDRRNQRLDELGLRLEASVQRLLRIHTRRFAPLMARLRSKDISAAIAATHRRLRDTEQRLRHTATQITNIRQTRLIRASERLEALSPLGVLSRGYALIYSVDGTLLRSAADTSAGKMIRAHLAKGTLEATVTRLNPLEKDAMETSNS
jgi:exodeoxyribonuclease VII large subunit